MIDFKQELAEIIADKYPELKQEEITALIEIPPREEMGDFALPCFQFARIFRKSPVEIAAEMTAEITVGVNSNPYFSRIKNLGPYVNFFIERDMLARTVLEEIYRSGEDYGRSDLGKGCNVVIDYSSPNIAKPFHVGHLRSTVIGNSLYRIYQFLGYNCIGINHLGDWGTQFGKMIAAYQHWGSADEIKKDPIATLLKLYVRFHQEAEKDPSLESEGRSWFKKLEDGDEEAHRLWKWFVELSMQEFNKIYQLLGVHFDYNTGESFYNDKMDRVVELLREKNLLVESQGAYVVDLEEYDMPPCLILKSDGATLYPTRDIAAAIYRQQEFNFQQALYVTDYSQKLHFAQWMKVIELMGFGWAERLEHVPFGRVSTEEGALQTRKGNVILLKDLLDKSIQKVGEIIEENNPDLAEAEKQSIARKVGIGAVIFNDLSNSKIKDIVFDWERMLSFDGETGPYVQYTYARAGSVLRKADWKAAPLDDYQTLTGEVETMVLKLLEQFPGEVVRAAERNEPSLITRQIIELAKAFNKFYHEYPIIVEDKKIQQARLLLVSAVKTVLRTGLNLLGIEAPEKM